MIRRAWDWFWYGRTCGRCKIERTGSRFIDDLCITCEVVEVIKWRMGS